MSDVLEHPISVEPADYERSGGIPIFTQLFRKDANLPEALQAVDARHDTDTDISAVSLACSVGAEADTLFALHRRLGRAGGIVLRGFDIDPRAVRAANEGRYISLPISDYEFGDVTRTLHAHGFTETTKRHGDRYPQYVARIDSAQVRNGYTAEFVVGDVINDLRQEEAGADLVLVNNILFHLSPDDAAQLARNAAQMLGKGGVLSFGDNPKQVAMDSNAVQTSMSYQEWLLRTAEVLTKEYGLTPILEGSKDAPVMYARD